MEYVVFFCLILKYCFWIKNKIDGVSVIECLKCNVDFN